MRARRETPPSVKRICIVSLVRTPAIAWRDLGFASRGLIGFRGPIVIARRHVEEEDALADTVLAPLKLLIAVEAEAQASTLLHLSLREAFYLSAFNGDRRCCRCWRRRGGREC